MENKKYADYEPRWLSLKTLQAKLGYQFKDMELLERALTHSSFANEVKKPEQHNERQEFLGDAVLELSVSTELYRRFPNAREGELTKLRSTLVSGESLAKIARELNLEKVMKLGLGEEKQGGRERDSILGDGLEAVLAAIYEDGGFLAAQECVKKIFDGHWPEKALEAKTQDNKSRLQQVCQKKFGGLPVYALTGTHGAEHEKKFEVSVTLPDGKVFMADNSSCKKAEQDAAKKALDKLMCP